MAMHAPTKYEIARAHIRRSPHTMLINQQPANDVGFRGRRRSRRLLRPVVKGFVVLHQLQAQRLDG